MMRLFARLFFNIYLVFDPGGVLVSDKIWREGGDRPEEWFFGSPFSFEDSASRSHPDRK